jgi:methylthioribulose 1-phosphate dehydratase / enolase-phosphatase E1
MGQAMHSLGGGNTQVGDLRPYLCGFFDTASGPKQAAASYSDIAASIGADSPGDIVFATDVLAEAQVRSCWLLIILLSGNC